MVKGAWFLDCEAPRRAVALVVLLVTACSTPARPPPAAPAVTSGPAAARAADPAPTAASSVARVRATYAGATAAMTPIWIALDSGLFQRHGLEVELTATPAGDQAIAALIAGELDFVQVSGSTTAAAIVGGADLLVVATTLRTLVQSLVVRPEIESGADLRGKAVGISRFGTSTDTTAQQALQHLGLVPQQDTAIVQIGAVPEILSALAANAVQGGTLSYPTITLARRQGYRELVDVASLGRPYAFTGISVRRSYAAEQPARVQAFVEAEIEAIALAKHDPALAKATVARYLRLDDAEVVDEAYTVYVDHYLERMPAPTAASMQAVLDEMATANPRAASAQPASLYDDRFVRTLEASGAIDRLYR